MIYYSMEKKYNSGRRKWMILLLSVLDCSTGFSTIKAFFIVVCLNYTLDIYRFMTTIIIFYNFINTVQPQRCCGGAGRKGLLPLEVSWRGHWVARDGKKKRTRENNVEFVPWGRNVWLQINLVVLNMFYNWISWTVSIFVPVIFMVG